MITQIEFFLRERLPSQMKEKEIGKPQKVLGQGLLTLKVC